MVTLFRNLGLPEHARPLAQLIQDFDPTVFLERLPDGHPWLEGNPDKPYAVIHRHPNFPEYVIESYSADRLDHRVFANLAFGDANRHDWDLAEFDPVGTAAMLLEGRRREDENEAANDYMAFKQGTKRSY